MTERTPVQIVEATLAFTAFTDRDMADYLIDLDPGLGPDIQRCQRFDVHMDGRSILTLQVRCPYSDPLKAFAFLGAQLSNSLHHTGLPQPLTVTFLSHPEALEATPA